MIDDSHKPRWALGLLLCAAGGAFAIEAPRAQIRYQDITGSLGIQYRRTPSANYPRALAAYAQPQIPMSQFATLPIRSRGWPGIALFDYDLDGDLDIYVTNGPGAPNSLLQNQLRQTGQLGFVDVGTAAGVSATAQDSTGVCYGDTDNDGDPDLLVLGRNEPNRFFENRGNGTFAELTPAGELGLARLGSASAAMGDVDGDGLLDIYVANAISGDSIMPIMFEPFADNHPNQLFRNLGGNRFEDVTQASGLAENPPLITWAATLVDYDQDGDLDIIDMNDQAAVPKASQGGVDRGFVRLFRNDGNGAFQPVQLGLLVGEFMGLDIADFNHDGHLDLFGSNGGDWLLTMFGMPVVQGEESSRWYLGDGRGGFTDPGVGSLGTGPFAWGCAAEDYDNDGDTDIVHVGGIVAETFVELSNPGTVLANDGNASFSYDATALGGGTHLRTTEQGAAMGDLDGDGFLDLVSASSIEVPGDAALVPHAVNYGSVFDPAHILPMMQPVTQPGSPMPVAFIPLGVALPNGRLRIERNLGNDNRSATVRALGATGLTPGARTPRDGIGAVIKFTPDGGRTAIKPVLGGSSYASQNPCERHFGMGAAPNATVEILWPGGARNRLYGVRPGEDIAFPEIPCSFTSDLGAADYARCVAEALGDHLQHGLVTRAMARRLFWSAIRAYYER